MILDNGSMAFVPSGGGLSGSLQIGNNRDPEFCFSVVEVVPLQHAFFKAAD